LSPSFIFFFEGLFILHFYRIIIYYIYLFYVFIAPQKGDSCSFRHAFVDEAEREHSAELRRHKEELKQRQHDPLDPFEDKLPRSTRALVYVLTSLQLVFIIAIFIIVIVIIVVFLCGAGSASGW
jgi:hypothetical protein